MNKKTSIFVFGVICIFFTSTDDANAMYLDYVTVQLPENEFSTESKRSSFPFNQLHLDHLKTDLKDSYLKSNVSEIKKGSSNDATGPFKYNYIHQSKLERPARYEEPVLMSPEYCIEEVNLVGDWGCQNDPCSFFYLQAAEGTCVGCNVGYTTAGLYSEGRPLFDNMVLPFTDLRLHYLNNNRLAANIGGGVRFCLPELNGILGTNLYYDVRNLWGNCHQIGWGLEWLGPFCDVRFNTYFPFGQKHTSRLAKRYTFDNGYFVNYISTQKALAGGDIEVGTSLGRFCDLGCFDFYVALGPYYYKNYCCDHVFGGKWRIGMQWGNYATLEIRNYVDTVYDTNIQGVFTLYFPLRRNCCGSIDNLVYRQEVIVVSPTCCHWEKNY